LARILAIANQKGGVGKTTTAVNLAASLSVMEKKTLLVDLDPQANATSGVGGSPGGETDRNVYRVLMGEVTAAEAVRETALPFLHLLPASYDLIGAEIELVTMERGSTASPRRSRRWRRSTRSSSSIARPRSGC
jgi:chromosome partitioning protein